MDNQKKYQTPTSYYEGQQPKMEELAKEAINSISAWWQHILLVSSSIDAVLISLHIENSESQYIRLAFCLSILLLTLGVLCCSIVVYDHAMLPERGRQIYLDEFQKALQEDRKLHNVFCGYRKRTKILKKFSCCLFILSLISMLTYTIMRELLICN